MTGHIDSSAPPDRRREMVVAAVVAALLVSLIALVGGSVFSAYTRGSSSDGQDVAQGLQYLQQLDAQDVNTVRAATTSFRRQDIIDKVQSGELPVWSLFQGCVFFGDSRTVGLWTYEYLDTSQVVSDGGWTIADLQEHEDELAAKNPEYLFLCTGVNDVSIGLWPTPQEYADAYKSVIDELQAKMPGTKIVVNSIVPTSAEAFQRAPAWEQIPQYNVAVKAMCQQYGITYVDNDQISAQDYDFMYAEDGIHFTTMFYDDWGLNLAGALDLF